jgi:hypothetical protein
MQRARSRESSVIRELSHIAGVRAARKIREAIADSDCGQAQIRDRHIDRTQIQDRQIKFAGDCGQAH